jgi:hypothetical protein
MTIQARITKHLPLILTLFFAIFGIVKFAVQGPAWHHQNGDVNYIYLFTGLDYWSLLPSGINDQPAITVKLLNALVIGVVSGIRSLFINLTMEQDVLTHSELYLNIISFTVFAVVCLALYKFLKYAYSLTTDKVLWAVAALSFFASYVILVSLFVNKPEPYLIIAGLGIGYLVIKRVIAKQEPTTWELLGICLFAVFSKITILPFLLVILTTFPSRNSLFKFLSKGLILLVIITAIWWSELTELVDFFIKTSTHGGAYGSGGTGFYDESWRENLLVLLRINPILISILILGIVRLFSNSKNRNAVVAMFISYMVFFLFILKNPFSHYFVPCYALLPAYLLVAFQDVKLSPFKTVLIPICIAFLLYRGMLFGKFIQLQDATWRHTTAPVGIQNYFSSSKAFCVLGADIYQDYRHKEEVMKLFPTDTIYWFDNTIRDAVGIIPHAAVKGEFTITGTSENIELDSQLTVLQKREKDRMITYRVVSK